MTMDKELAVITGASSGIGLEMSRILAARKYDLLLVSRSGEKLAKLAKRLVKQHGVEVHYLAVDLSEQEGARKVFEFVFHNNLNVSILINNAGVGLLGEHTDLDTENLLRMLQLNIWSVCELSRLFGKKMKRQRNGKILNIASTAAYQPTPYFAAYGATKSFVLNFSEALAKELEDYGVTVSCFSPGPTDTRFFTEFDKEGSNNQHLNKSSRHEAGKVAEIGINVMLKGQLSHIPGLTNNLRTFSTRFAPRFVVANISKSIMKPVNNT